MGRNIRKTTPNDLGGGSTKTDIFKKQFHSRMEKNDKVLIESGYLPEAAFRNPKHGTCNPYYLYATAFGSINISISDIEGKGELNINTNSFIDSLIKESWIESYSSLRLTIDNNDITNVETFLIRKDKIAIYIKSYYQKNEKDVEGIYTLDSLTIYYPSSMIREDIEKIIREIGKLVENSLVDYSEKVRIGMVAHEDGSYYVKDFDITKHTPQLSLMDLHYGDGFENFHSNLLSIINKSNKGLVLFHGEPGTGKTHYIRYLLKHILKENRRVLYVPPSFSTQLTDPQIISFISGWIMDGDRDCILLIEDAEPLLESRSNGNSRTSGVTNLLNMTDGILNDILGILVIATFNTDLSKIDEALLRPGRLIARKEFGRLDEKRSNELSSKLDFNISNMDIQYPITLADFYTIKNKNNILIHDVKQDNNAIGFNNRPK